MRHVNLMPPGNPALTPTTRPVGVYHGTPSAHDNSVPSTGTFMNYSVAALPSPWQSVDVGSVLAAGSAVASAGTFNVTGSGADIYGMADAFRYAWQAATGDCDITARVTDVQNVQAFAKAGVMIRETLNAGSAQAAVLTPQNGLQFDSRNATTASTAIAYGPSNSPPTGCA